MTKSNVVAIFAAWLLFTGSGIMIFIINGAKANNWGSAIFGIYYSICILWAVGFAAAMSSRSGVGDELDWLRIRPLSLPDVIFAFATGFLFIFIAGAIVSVVGNQGIGYGAIGAVGQLFESTPSTQKALFLALFQQFFVVAVAEELFYRGVITNHLFRITSARGFGYLGIIAGSVVFTIAHFSTYSSSVGYYLAALAFSVIVSIMYIYKGLLWGVIAHGTYNSFVTLSLTSQIIPGYQLLRNGTVPLSYGLIAAIAIIVIITLHIDEEES